MTMITGSSLRITKTGKGRATLSAPPSDQVKHDCVCGVDYNRRGGLRGCEPKLKPRGYQLSMTPTYGWPTMGLPGPSANGAASFWCRFVLLCD